MDFQFSIAQAHHFSEFNSQNQKNGAYMKYSPPLCLRVSVRENRGYSFGRTNETMASVPEEEVASPM